jgi:hypothetical protein
MAGGTVEVLVKCAGRDDGFVVGCTDLPESHSVSVPDASDRVRHPELQEHC